MISSLSLSLPCSFPSLEVIISRPSLLINFILESDIFLSVSLLCSRRSSGLDFDLALDATHLDL